MSANEKVRIASVNSLISLFSRRNLRDSVTKYLDLKEIMGLRLLSKASKDHLADNLHVGYIRVMFRKHSTMCPRIFICVDSIHSIFFGFRDEHFEHFSSMLNRYKFKRLKLYNYPPVDSVLESQTNLEHLSFTPRSNKVFSKLRFLKSLRSLTLRTLNVDMTGPIFPTLDSIKSLFLKFPNSDTVLDLGKFPNLRKLEIEDLGDSPPTVIGKASLSEFVGALEILSKDIVSELRIIRPVSLCYDIEEFDECYDKQLLQEFGYSGGIFKIDHSNVQGSLQFVDGRWELQLRHVDSGRIKQLSGFCLWLASDAGFTIKVDPM